MVEHLGAVDSGVASETREERAVHAVEDAGHQRGLALCECPALKIPIADVEGCARDESGVARNLQEPDTEKCAIDLAAASQVFFDYLVCETDHLSRLAECEKTSCPKIDLCSNVTASTGNCQQLPSDVEKQWHGCLMAGLVP